MTYRTLLVGLGKIGFGYSGHTKKSDALLTHTEAILSHQDFELTLGIDPNPLVRAQFEDSTKLQTLESVSNIRDVEQFDLVVIATPTQDQEETLREILRLTPRAVLMEKPLSPDLEGAKRIKELLQESDVKLAMNFQRSYTRRFARSVSCESSIHRYTKKCRNAYSVNHTNAFPRGVSVDYEGRQWKLYLLF